MIEYSEEKLIACSGCGEEYIHQVGFIWFQREEDATQGTAYFVEHGKAGKYEFKNEESANPSKRRHGSIAVFACENCNSITGVHFSQHKGLTISEIKEVDKTLIKTTTHSDLSSQGIRNGTIVEI